jgi:hypothetical protein
VRKPSKFKFALGDSFILHKREYTVVNHQYCYTAEDFVYGVIDEKTVTYDRLARVIVDELMNLKRDYLVQS